MSGSLSEQQRRLRERLSDAYMALQNQYIAEGATPAEILPMITAALVSLAVYIGRSINLSQEDLRALMQAAIEDEWRAAKRERRT